ncbi:MAG: hypothetical protein AB7E49_10415 [Campylobacterales bacterium]
MKRIWLFFLIFPLFSAAQMAPKATPTFKAFAFVQEGDGWLRPNAALGAIGSVESFEREFKADGKVPALLLNTQKTKETPKPEAQPERKDKFIELDPMEQKKQAYGQRLKENERAYYEQVRARKQQYYKQIDGRSLLME